MYHLNVALLQEDFQTLDFRRQHMAQPRKWRWQCIDKTGNSCSIYVSKEWTNKILEHVYISTWPDKKYTYPKQVEREVHEGMLQIAQNLIIWDGINTTLMQSATEWKPQPSLPRVLELGHKDLHFQWTGLTPLPSHLYMGTSSDGLTINHHYHKDNGVLEIKCPFPLRSPKYTISHQLKLPITTTRNSFWNFNGV